MTYKSGSLEQNTLYAQQFESYIGCIQQVGGTRDPKADTILTPARAGVEMARVYAEHPEWKPQSSKRGTRKDKTNPATAMECYFDNVDFQKCWETRAY